MICLWLLSVINWIFCWTVASMELLTKRGCSCWVLGFVAWIIIPNVFGAVLPIANDMFDNFAKHPCRRQCKLGLPMTCYYKLYIHNYQMLGPECRGCLTNPLLCQLERCIYGDGEFLPLKLINYQFPGPPIEVCQYDTLIVDTYNNLTEDTTMHWHGIHMSKTPESDGVPMVTQYPIRPGDIHRVCYQAEEVGTMWYHSHLAWQRGEGVWGIFIIRPNSKKDPHYHLYDYDDVRNSLQIHDIGGKEVPRNIVINGKGRNQNNLSISDMDPRHRYHRLFVTPLMRHRIRIVFNGVTDCPVEITFEDHSFLVIATDGNDIEPIVADKIQLTSGERFDVIIYARNKPGVYWITIRGMNDCENLIQYALLHYKGVPQDHMPTQAMMDSLARQSQVVVNGIGEKRTNPEKDFYKELPASQNAILTSKDSLSQSSFRDFNIPTISLKSLEPMPCLAKEDIFKVYLTLGYVSTDDGLYLHINNITYAAPSLAMLQARHLYAEDQMYCNRTSLRDGGANCLQSHCECTHVIRIPAFRCIELIVANNMETTHPFHLHGYTFRVVGQDSLGDLDVVHNIEEIDRHGRLQRHSPDYRAVAKDTVQIPSLGYVILRFKSNNPGFWLMHCHIERHSLEGMTAVLKVGDNHQIPKVSSVNICEKGFCG